MVRILENQTIRILQKALKKGVVLLDLEEYKKIRAREISTYYLEGKESEELDKLVVEGMRDYEQGKCKKIKSLSDLD